MVSPLYSFQHDVMPSLVQEDPGLFYFLAEKGAEAYYSLINNVYAENGVSNPYEVKDCHISRLKYMNISIVVLHDPDGNETGLCQDLCLIYDVDTRELRYFCTECGPNSNDGKRLFTFYEFAKNGKRMRCGLNSFKDGTQASLYGIRLFLTQFMHCNVKIPFYKANDVRHPYDSNGYAVVCPACDKKYVLDMTTIEPSETYIHICPKCGEIMFANWGGTTDES